ncbi:MobA/MobL family protein [Rhizobium sp. DKSPLA3]|uniref:MobA/MobL family protein n=1 Tax=Rhizobium quercicola TaxID=2901226 RepID=A0A9X1T2Q5_9HYPH|nr:MobQ family relaxase [Rhizobium quercicola]MCD7111822.1 MobA/MobL family protein [Rhizobium quercicola]
MAIYHFSGQVLGRSVQVNPDGTRRPGSNAVAAAAYRAGEKLTDRSSNRGHDYSRRKGVVHAEIMAPLGSAPWLEDRETLWNTVEAMETRKDAQLAREFNMALPHELDPAQRLELVRDFVSAQFVRRGMVADLALHAPVTEDGQNARNHHAHVMLTMRRATPDGLDPVKTREWNSREMLNVWRSEWALACNMALERAGKRQRVDHRTLQAQRDEAVARKDHAAALELKRQPEIHVGPKPRQMKLHDRAPQSRQRLVGPVRKRDGKAAPATRRKRDYLTRDRGSRIDRLREILVGNNEELKRDLKAIDRRFNRLARKMDYWDRRITFKLEGVIKGKEFRFNRWKAAEAEKAALAERQRQAAHARKRLEQLKSLVSLFQGVGARGAQRRETILGRAREVESWMVGIRRLAGRSLGKSSARGRGRSRERIF